MVRIKKLIKKAGAVKYRLSYNLFINYLLNICFSDKNIELRLNKLVKINIFQFYYTNVK